jgi:hypothetical protein
MSFDPLIALTLLAQMVPVLLAWANASCEPTATSAPEEPTT